jgi:hypothetical protein
LIIGMHAYFHLVSSMNNMQLASTSLVSFELNLIIGTHAYFYLVSFMNNMQLASIS